jgi:hypothetical protein
MMPAFLSSIKNGGHKEKIFFLSFDSTPPTVLPFLRHHESLNTGRIKVKVKSAPACKVSRENNSADLLGLKSKWPSTVVARKKFREFSGGLVSPGTVANADCVGEGPDGAFMIGRNVGYHAWIFFSEAVPAWKARVVAFALLREAGVISEDQRLSSFDRLFPNQDQPSGKGFGNLIALPFQGQAAEKGHTLFLDPATEFEKPFEKQLTVLKTIQFATEADLERIIGAWNLDQTRTGSGTKSANSFREKLDPDQILKGVEEGRRDDTLFRYACHLRARNFTKPEAEVLVLSAARNCSPPFSESEAIAKVDQAWKYEESEKTEGSFPKVTRKDLADRIESLDGKDDFEVLTGEVVRDVLSSGLPESHILSLLKFIAKKTKVSVSSLRAGAKGFEQVIADKDFNHLEAAREVVKGYGFGNIIGSISHTWHWDGTGVWKQIQDREIKQAIHLVADSDQLTRNIVDSVLDLFKTEIHKPGHIFDAQHELINVRNGVLHYQNGLWVLRKHCREHYLTTQLPVAYDPEATAPRFTQFLDEIFRDDEDSVTKPPLSWRPWVIASLPTVHLRNSFC